MAQLDKRWEAILFYKPFSSLLKVGVEDFLTNFPIQFMPYWIYQDPPPMQNWSAFIKVQWRTVGGAGNIG